MTSVDRIQGLSGSLAIKVPCRVATTTAIVLAGLQTIDGVVLVEGDRVLVKNQTNTTENGIYEVSTGTWSRASDFDGVNDVTSGTLVPIAEGAANSGNVMKLSASTPTTPGETSLTFAALLVASPEAGYLPLTGGDLSGPLSVSGAAVFLSDITGATRQDVASANTLDLDSTTTNFLRVTGTTAVTAITLADGSWRWCVMEGAVTLTHGANLIIPGAANYTTAAGDIVLCMGAPSAVVHALIFKADGTAVVADSAASTRTQDFRLTLTSGTPVTTADVTAAATIYCTPYKGNQISLYDGASWVTRTSAQFSKALGTLTSGKPYDVFCYDNAGTPTLEFLAWSSDTNRATALAYQDGILVKSGGGEAAKRRYLGTFYTTSTTQTEDSASKRYLYNYYHRVARHLAVVDTTDSWSHIGAVWRQARASASNQVEFIQGVAEDAVEAEVAATTQTGTGSTAAVAIGLDSTTPVAQVRAAAAVSGTIYVPTWASYRGIPAAGRHALMWLEYGNGTAVTFYGDAGATIMQSGLTARVMA